ncbi:mitochondrial S-adenosylmethionine carrier protein isoform X4 [Rhineura floridana]|uniref:mitochondrial S-adenosylmethionine carrier protein isoform X4 n=1 Tax=Rhineura floridana TaxID=261503 RepID=UPI002AC88C9B|nr:mitochondrial S-adenosylmethionine carrier protein isoform X4 [Rhineura floridana]
MVACLIRVPSEVVKQRAQVSPSASTLRILSNTVCEEGILGLYRGYKSTVLREQLESQCLQEEGDHHRPGKETRLLLLPACLPAAATAAAASQLPPPPSPCWTSALQVSCLAGPGPQIPFSLVQFPLWESLKDLWSWKQGHVVESWQSAVCGAFAGGFAAAVTTPLDVAKTRIMLAKTGSRNASGNVLSALHGVWRSQGISGLFAGIIPRISAISLGGFIFLGMYDKIRSLLS